MAMEHRKNIIAWFSCGITSAVACKLAINKYGAENVNPVYIGINTAHGDNERFIIECEKWLGKGIERISSVKYKNQFEVIEKTGYVNGAAGARCTGELKKVVRKLYEENNPFSGQIFGFEFTRLQINRAIRFAQQNPHTKPIFPLIERGLTKEQCAFMLIQNGIELPTMYKLGYQNNNCIGCVKGGMGYWNKIRYDFPEIFDRMAKTERLVGHSCIKNKFLDELNHNAGRTESTILPDCGTFCEIEFADLLDENTEKVFNREINIETLH